MDHDSPDSPKSPAPRSRRRGSGPAAPHADLPPEGLATGDIDPATVAAEEDDEARLPEVAEEAVEAAAGGPLSVGPATIVQAVKVARTSPAVCPLLYPAN